MKPVLIHKRKGVTVHPKEPVAFVQGINELMSKIEKRAYELFDGRGRENGHDLDDWFKAESEFFQLLPLEIKEEKKRLLIRAEVPGFNAEDLEISLEPACLTIRGSQKKQTEQKEKEPVCSETTTKEVFRRMVLPFNVLPDKAEASLSRGVLEIRAPKEAEAKRLDVAA